MTPDFNEVSSFSIEVKKEQNSNPEVQKEIFFSPQQKIGQIKKFD